MEYKEETLNENNGKVYQSVSFEDEDIDEYCKTMPLTEETQCGFGFLKGPMLQKMANKKVLILLVGFSTTIFGATFSYFSATITTMEKVFKIPSKTIGIISVGNDIVKLFGSVLFTHYASKGHQPRWMAFGVFCSALACFLNAMPHFQFGSGNDLLYTYELGGNYSTNSRSIDKQLCGLKDTECDIADSNMYALAYLFLSQMLQGIGGTAIYGVSLDYLDNNIQKKKAPIVMSLMMFMRFMSPTAGYLLSTICLKIYIRPDFNPSIKKDDSRWLGAWWLGWLVLGFLSIIASSTLAMLPKKLPRAAARKALIKEKNKKEELKQSSIKLNELVGTLKRLITNPIYVINLIAINLYIFGYLPFWTFLQKYMEVMFRVTAADSSTYTGIYGFICSGIGILCGGYLLHKFKPRSKTMAFCSALATTVGALGVFCYVFVGCADIEEMTSNSIDEPLNTTMSCNVDCDCDFVKFNQICSMDGTQSFISPCHAGCSQTQVLDNKTIVYKNCSCIIPNASDEGIFGSAKPGPCPVDCQIQMIAFVVIICIVKFVNGLAGAVNFLISMRCVEERDKPVSLSINLTTLSVLTLIPAPIVYGFIFDSACLVWSKTCSGEGNCWLFNSSLLRKRVTLTSLSFMIFSSALYYINWFIMKDFNVFSEVIEVKNDNVVRDDDTKNLELVKK